MKKKWLLVPIVAAVIALAVMGGTALAQGDSSTNTSSPWSTFAGKVASILGLDEATVQNAMDQARKEIQNEALQARLDALVESGKLTQEQADQYYQWYQSRPEGIDGGLMGGFGKGGRFGGRGWGGMRFGGGPCGQWSGNAQAGNPATTPTVY